MGKVLSLGSLGPGFDPEGLHLLSWSQNDMLKGQGQFGAEEQELGQKRGQK